MNFQLMYADKDKEGNISLMEISREEANDLGSALFEFELMVNHSSTLSEREKGRLALFSAKLRFLIIDALKENNVF